ncbi:deoxyribodipyrimidine photo-lyase [Chryseobacterium sp. H1D6B]|uniref:cryptochrome/photolyase family protein n=1 Tax=Chryseobacterium sp. H1D6B TaxID=2940588 RepID=UPI0015C72512|nr:deoxyribodipyrimidine photo-lyase [Chryseobacterium sp. H1D6B]MDH6250736.1 deoxyribodipyrimidine photo-lyase [Chryseobacterium sp. H1D6B]
MTDISIFWFRRDLRLEDNIGLSEALQSGNKVIPIFIFDTDILDQLEDKNDRRVDYIHQVLEKINADLKKSGACLQTYHGRPLEIFNKLEKEYNLKSVYCSRDYEPAAIKRDAEIKEFLQTKGIEFSEHKDQVVFEKNEVTKDNSEPYTVYTPYSKKWKKNLKPEDLQSREIKNENFHQSDFNNILSLKEIGFSKTDLHFEIPKLDSGIIDYYDKNRDFPALDATTHLGIALRFGTISIRKCVKFALEHNETWLNELIWREFFMQILFHFPKVVKRCFKEKYENIPWRNNEKEFEKWCKGETGYPIVDAGMRQLNETGQMHNRVRMIVASFLTKHLLIDWRWGEAYFAKKLLDYDLSANNGNWQWAAGCGCDAAPYFRVFNPDEQTKKFDKDLKYTKKWNSDFEKSIFNDRIVDHAFARNRALEAYKKGLNEYNGN